MVELLQITDAFQLSNIGLTVLPDFAVPPGGWKSESVAAMVATPDGRTITTTAQINITHFNIRDPSVPVDRRWRVVVTLPDLQKEAVPIGSTVLVPSEVKVRLLPASEA
jgi:hypothetical protein